MNYRHDFHAGNFADVLKHVVLMMLVEHLKKKSPRSCSSTRTPAAASTT